jgi:flagellar protein FliL
MGSKIIIASAAAAVLAASAAGGYFLYLRPAEVGGHPSAMQAATPRPPRIVYVDAKELTLRLADPSAEHYIKLSPVLAVRESVAEALKDKVPVLRDRMVTIITGRQSSELSTPEGQQKLKKDLLDALRQEFPNQVIDLYFSGYLVE